MKVIQDVIIKLNMNLQTALSQSNSRIYKSYMGKLAILGIDTIEDFLYHLPHRYEDYSVISKINHVQPGETVTIQGRVMESKNQYLRSARIRTIQRVTVDDGTGTIELTWFNQPFLIKSIIKSSMISVSGRVEKKAAKFTMMSPDFEILYDSNADPIHTARLIPVYPETKGISSKWLRRQIHKIILEHENEIQEYLPPDIIKKYNFPALKEAIKHAHFPRDINEAQTAKNRLSFDELLLIQLAGIKRRTLWNKEKAGSPLVVNKFRPQIDKFISSLPFTLTGAQQKAIGEVLHDLQNAKLMNRLLQGDVGSGKTVVATVAMYLAYLNKYQSILLAPTEILANQHYTTISNLLSPLGIKVDLITGNKKPNEIKGKISNIKTNKKNLKFEIENLKLDILIGTHALLSEKIKLNNLALVVIDEQQRFGVEQRTLIREKGKSTHLLTMTATPIPRTVALTMYGDLDLSYLNEMPFGRKKVKTWLVPKEKRDGAYKWIRKQINETKSQTFIICPFIEESESMQTIKAAAKEYERLKNEIFPDLKLSLLHGKLKPKEKQQVMNDFKNNKSDILVATPVVEVGIDIPNATIIMIEASERFGLAQLHQLRGRVGRGDKQSYCLLFSEGQNETTAQRLKSLEKIYSGAELAELDLRLRGSGDLYGTAQHGIPKLKIASFADTNLIRQTKHAADEIFPRLSSYVILEEKVNALTLKNVSPD